MDLNQLTDDERLVAERAVAALRQVKRSGDAAPMGKGLFCLEQAIHDHGFPSLREILQRSADGRPEAQKKGSVAGRARAGARRGSGVCSPSAS